MTLEEKCYLLSGKDFWQARSVERLNIPNMTLSDGPHGIRKQEGAGDHQLGLNGSLPATCYPTAATIANSWAPALGEELGEHLGVEAASQDVCVLLGRPIPNGHWSGMLDMNDAICQLYYAKSGLARFVYKIMTNMLNKSIAKGEPDLNITFIYNIPFRGIAKMAGGMCTMEMAEGILTIVNGHFFKGLGRVIGGFFRSGKKRKAANSPNYKLDYMLEYKEDKH